MNNISDFIKKGVSAGYSQNIVLQTSSCDFQSAITEYIFTVNVAQSLIDWNEQNNWRYSICVEYDALKFVNNAFASSLITYNNNSFFSPSITQARQRHNTTRVGRIDIVVLEQIVNNTSEFRSKVGIEIKAINPDLQLVKKDIARLSHALLETDSIGRNSIECCFVTFAQRLDNPEKVFEEGHYQGRKSRLEASITSILNDPELTGVKFFIEYFDITKTTGAEILTKMPYIEDYSEAAANSGAILGVLIRIGR